MSPSLQLKTDILQVAPTTMVPTIDPTMILIGNPEFRESLVEVDMVFYNADGTRINPVYVEQLSGLSSYITEVKAAESEGVCLFPTIETPEVLICEATAGTAFTKLTLTLNLPINTPGQNAQLQFADLKLYGGYAGGGPDSPIATFNQTENFTYNPIGEFTLTEPSSSNLSISATPLTIPEVTVAISNENQIPTEMSLRAFLVSASSQDLEAANSSTTDNTLTIPTVNITLGGAYSLRVEIQDSSGTTIVSQISSNTITFTGETARATLTASLVDTTKNTVSEGAEINIIANTNPLTSGVAHCYSVLKDDVLLREAIISPTQNYTPTTRGSYTVKLEMKNGDCVSGTNILEVTSAPVTIEDSLPVATITGQPSTAVRYSSPFTLTVSDITDADGDTITLKVVKDGTELRNQSGTDDFSEPITVGGYNSTGDATVTENYVVELTSNDQAVDYPFTVTVNANHLPVIQPLTQSAVEGDANIPVTLSGTDAEGTSLNYELDPTASPVKGTAALSGNTVTYTPNSPEVYGSETIRYRASDDLESSAYQNITFTITPVNDPPQLSADPISTPEDSTTITTTVTITDPDDTTFTCGTPTVAPTTLGTATVTCNGDGNMLSFTPSSNQFGTGTITLAVTDSGGGTAPSAPATETLSVAVTVESRNDFPTAIVTGTATRLVGEIITIDATGSTDIDVEDTLIVTFTAPAGITNTSQNPKIFTAIATAPGTYAFVITVSDGNSGEDITPFSVVVAGTESPGGEGASQLTPTTSLLESIVLGLLGGNATLLPGLDLNGDGKVNVLDIALLIRNTYTPPEQ